MAKPSLPLMYPVHDRRISRFTPQSSATVVPLALEDFAREVVVCDDAQLLDLCCRELLHGSPHVLNYDQDGYYYFRKRIANHFGIEYFNVFIVGSARLGFSPHKLTPFDLNSDVDIAIASSTLFDELMSHIYNFQMRVRESRKSVTAAEIRKYHEFLEYVAIGWIRPDKLPTSFAMEVVRNDWFRYFSSISHGKSEVGNYKLSAGVFRSFSFLLEYNLRNLRRLQSTRRAAEVADDHPNQALGDQP